MFITFEGPDGSGKSTQVPLLAEYLRQQGFDVLTTREPGGTRIGDQVRAILMDMENTAMRPNTEILLFLAARAQHVAEIIRPHLEKGGLVLCDRFGDSTLAYQGYGHQVDLGILRQMLRFATGGLQPDLTLLLDVDVETGLQRRRRGGDEWNRLDASELAFHRRVREGYLEMAAAEPQRWRVVDASRPVEVVQSAIRAAVSAALPAPR
ncbi:MAG TPA: dTMP kinase [Chloroflexi bacterium]|nr:dTMP kinase [Chloroflexota bacterium]HPO57216.1 dTMP kinase [Anaerolineaceae bacterium]